ncbi:MAG: heme ABC transporter ATP-binding protein [Aggregatilineales bacterium]|nr:heme ABC transporter ATP-binding protein [Aggregatilineales bacterium]HPV07873.1 heme ABC transporter ATP-binding protein [Aggregatilineales bacterium]
MIETRHAAGPGAPLIEARSVSVGIDGVDILRGVTAELHAGELVGLIGPNGAGKTTLLKALGGLIGLTGGEVRLLGQPLTAYSPREIARVVAHVPQVTVTEFAFTVREIVLMGRSPHLGRFQLEQASDREIAARAMARMHVDHLADRIVTTLSGGERQRVFIARALAQQPRVLLLDEPTANLDVKHQLDVLETAARLAREENLGIIAAIHDLNLAAHYCDRLVLLEAGRVLADNAPEAVLTPQNLSRAFEVQAHVYRDPYTQGLRLSLTRSGNGHREPVQAQHS